MKRFVPVLLVLPLSACLGKLQTEVTQRASDDTGCATSEITVTDMGSGQVMPKAYSAKGCGQETYYEGGCSIFGMCTLYDQQQATAQQERIAAQQAAAAEAYANRPPPSSASATTSPGHSGQAGAPTPAAAASVTLRGECPQTVKLFFGDKPKFGSGRTSSIGSNHVQSASMRVGDTVWVVDDSGNGLASYTASPGSQTVIVTCGGFRRQ